MTTVSLSRRLLTVFLGHQLRRSLGRLGQTARFASCPATPTPFAYDVTLERRHGRIHLGLPEDAAEIAFQQRENVTAYLYLLLHSPETVGAITVACNDGDNPSAARFAPSSRDPRIIALPDRYFILRDGFAAERRLAEKEAVAWSDRSATITWRGGANGHGIHPLVAADAHNPRVIQRARLCMLLDGVAGTDARLTAGNGQTIPLSAFAPLGITGTMRPERDWLGDKYAIDIDGWTNAWSNLVVRMHFGCCVLKVASADDYRQWWYDRLVPWEHYVPVSADMSDLRERIDWVRSHDRQAAAIARAGQALVRTMTLKSETQNGAELISLHWQGVAAKPATQRLRLVSS